MMANFMYYSKKLKEYMGLPNHSFKRVANRFGNLGSRILSTTHVYGLPSTLMIEISSACQLKCPLCPIGSDTLKRRRQIMPLDTFKKIIDELGDYLYRININGMGEPLLNNSIIEMVRYAKSKNIYVDLYTNFEITDKHNIIEGLVDAGLDAALIAIDGASKEIYEQYRVKGDFDRVTRNVRSLVHERKKAGTTIPEINIQFVQMKQNQHQADAMIDMADELGADALIIKRPFLFWGQKKQADQYLPDDNRLNMYKIDGDKIAWKGKEKKICELLWTSSVILPDGSVAPCCFDYEGHANFGNIHEKSFSEIWNGGKYKTFRVDMKNDWKSITLCANEFEGGCPNMFMQPDDWLLPSEKKSNYQDDAGQKPILDKRDKSAE